MIITVDSCMQNIPLMLFYLLIKNARLIMVHHRITKNCIHLDTLVDFDSLTNIIAIKTKKQRKDIE